MGDRLCAASASCSWRRCVFYASLPLCSSFGVGAFLSRSPWTHRFSSTVPAIPAGCSHTAGGQGQSSRRQVLGITNRAGDAALFQPCEGLTHPLWGPKHQ